MDISLLHVLPSSIPIMAKWSSSCMNMLIMVEATPSTLQVKLNGSRTPVMTTQTHSPALSNFAQHKHAITTQPIDFEKLRPYFGWVNIHTVEKTFHKTTQWAVASTRYPMQKHFKSRFPAFNIPRRSEEVATDTIFSDTPAIDSGVTMAQTFAGK